MRNIPAIIEKFKTVPAGLSITTVANLMGVSHNTAREYAKIAGYVTKDGRSKEFWAGSVHPGGHSKGDWSKADWSKDDGEIAIAVGVSRARVWQKRGEQKRALFGKPINIGPAPVMPDPEDHPPTPKSDPPASDPIPKPSIPA